MDTLFDRLVERLKIYKKLCIAYSGGADSTLLLYAAVCALGKENLLAVNAKSLLVCGSDSLAAAQNAARLGVEPVTIELDVLAKPEVASNSPMRCYHCKYMILSAIKQLAGSKGVSTIADGTNADDKTGYRPGMLAAQELEVVSPLKELGYTKAQVYADLGRLKLDFAARPSNSCLATRIPYNREIKPQELEKIAKAEQLILSLGAKMCRVRLDNNTARVELDPQDFDLILQHRQQLLRLGFDFITLDLAGYTSGCYDNDLLSECPKIPKQ